MKRHENRKKKLIISNENLTEELKELFKEAYPEGYKDCMQKIVKPDGTPIFVVPLETEETSYMVKFDVRIDTHLADDEWDREINEGMKDDEPKFEPLPDEESPEKDNDHKEYNLNHGAYEDSYTMGDFDDDSEEEDEEKDEYNDDYDDDDYDDEDEKDNNEEDDFEPSADDIADLEENMTILTDEELLSTTKKTEKSAKKAEKPAKKTAAKKETTAKASAKKTTKTTKAKAEKTTTAAKKTKKATETKTKKK